MAEKRRRSKVSKTYSISDFDVDDTCEEKEGPPSVPKPVSTKSIIIRTVAGLSMVGFYLGLIRAGHVYCLLVSVSVQFECFRELVNLRYVEAKERAMPLFRTLQWMWFLIAITFVYGEAIHKFFIDTPRLHKLTTVTRHLDKFFFVLYCIAFMLTVLTLRKGMIRFQMGQLMWTVVTIMMIVFQCKFLASNILNGLFWFMFPMSMVIMNDASAYFCGISMGRKYIQAPFMALSPNKTWEGYIGAAVCTTIFSFFFSWLLAQFSWLTCPADDFYMWHATGVLQCELHPVFLTKVYTLPRVFDHIPGPIAAAVANWLQAQANAPVLMVLKPFFEQLSTPVWKLALVPVQLHGLAFGLFASIVAPFGGFFASAIKRAYRRKDFDAFLPGHGGLMDRMDCMLLMILFTSVYYRTVIHDKVLSVGQVVAGLSALSMAEKQMVYDRLVTELSNGMANGGNLGTM